MKHIDLLVVAETKLDYTFRTSQFLNEGFVQPFRLDQNRNGGGAMIYICDDIPSKLIVKHVFPT